MAKAKKAKSKRRVVKRSTLRARVKRAYRNAKKSGRSKPSKASLRRAMGSRFAR